MNFRKIRRYLKNIPGWRTNRKILVIESDDWGSIRMPSRSVYEKCLNEGYPVDQNVYEQYDSLASERDLELLFELLASFRDKNGQPPTITANVLVANPDFDEIREADFQEYYYELVTDTMNRYPAHGNCFNLWLEGKENGFFHPQSHGREHLNVSEYMAALRSGDKDLLFAFELGMPGSLPKNSEEGSANKYVEALRYLDRDDKEQKLSILLEGLKLFEDLFGYRSESFIANNYFWSPDYDAAMAREGVRFYQGNRKMREIQLDGGKKYHTHYLGKQNKHGQYYLVRNAVFEPTLHKTKISDPVEHCLADISAAFRMKKPAIICSHRINYVGFMDESNRDDNLKMLEELLREIIKQWPEVEFMSSDQLGRLIAGDLS